MDFLFDVVEVNRIEARHDPRNPHSGNVMKKCGMKFEGTLRSSDWNNQGICDACYYGLLNMDIVSTTSISLIFLTGTSTEANVATQHTCPFFHLLLYYIIPDDAAQCILFLFAL